MSLYQCPQCQGKELAVNTDQGPTVFIDERGNVAGGDDVGTHTWSERAEAHCPARECSWVGPLSAARLSVRIERLLREKLAGDLEIEERGYQIHCAIAGVLKDFVGKKLTKRFTDKVTAAITPLFPTPPVCFYPHPGKLVVWHTPSIPYDHRELFFIASDASCQNPSHSILHPTLEGFEYDDQSHGRAAVERNARRRGLLEKSNPALRQIARQVEAIRSAKLALTALCEPFDSQLRYEAERLVKEA
jgi:hypothetical protein